MKKRLCIIMMVVMLCLGVMGSAEEEDWTLFAFDKAFGKSPSELSDGYTYDGTTYDTIMGIGSIWLTDGKEPVCVGDTWYESYGEDDRVEYMEVSMPDMRSSARFLADAPDPLGRSVSESIMLAERLCMTEGVWVSDVDVGFLHEEILWYVLHLITRDYAEIEIEWSRTDDGDFVISGCSVEDISGMDAGSVDMTEKARQMLEEIRK